MPKHQACPASLVLLSILNIWKQKTTFQQCSPMVMASISWRFVQLYPGWKNGHNGWVRDNTPVVYKLQLLWWDCVLNENKCTIHLLLCVPRQRGGTGQKSSHKVAHGNRSAESIDVLYQRSIWSCVSPFNCGNHVICGCTPFYLSIPQTRHVWSERDDCLPLIAGTTVDSAVWLWQ